MMMMLLLLLLPLPPPLAVKPPHQRDMQVSTQ